jgi:membrane fusion protein, multidrug efflux system
MVLDICSTRRVQLAWLCLSGFWLLGCDRSPPITADAAAIAERPEVVGEVVVVTPQLWPRAVRAQGSLLADAVVTISPKVSGRVKELEIDFGDRIAAGSLLVQLEEEEYLLRVMQAEAELVQALSAVGLQDGQSRSSLDPQQSPPVREAKAIWDEAKLALDRLRGLVDRELGRASSISLAELDAARASVEVAEARYGAAVNQARERIAQIAVCESQLGLARRSYEETRILAPLEGVVVERLVNPGSYVQAGQPILVLARMDRLRFRATVPERYADRLQVGQVVQVWIDRLGQAVETQVSRISPSLDMATRSLTFEAWVENPLLQLQAGRFAEADLILDPEATSLAVPLTSVIRFAGVDKVWKVVNGELVEQVVRLGRQADQRWEVLEGIEPGDQVLTQSRLGRQGPFRSAVSTSSI